MPRLVQVTGAVAIGALVLAGCASGTTAESPPPSAPTAPSDTVPEDGDFAATIDLGDGRTMHLECSGTGSPTVLFISGTGNAGDVWREAEPPTEDDGAVFPTTARATRVCAYDRPGTLRSDGSPGESSAVAQPTSTRDDAADLHALVAAANIPGPYVLVAHSVGGLIATTYARSYPDDIVGLVLVDPASEFMEAAMGDAAWGQYVEAALSNVGTGTETIDPAASNAAINDLPALPAIPVVVLSSDQPWFILPFGEGGALVDYSSALLESQTQLATSLGATHITQTNSAHDIYIENAPLVNEQICVVLGPSTGC